MQRKTQPGIRPLSEVKKHLIIPSGIASSDWPAIQNTCNNKLGIEFDEWQNGAGKLLLAKRADGFFAHTIGGYGMSICRQTGKSYFLSGAIFGMCVEWPGILCIWSAHHSKTHGETFIGMQAFASRTKIKPFIQDVFKGSGDEEVRFHNGSRILFGARERGFGRGIPGVDVLISDEGQIMSEAAMQNMLATMNTSMIAIHIYAGTPPKPGDNSENWLRMRSECLSGVSEDTVWIEMGADDDADLDDHQQWRKANPSVPHRTPIHAMQRLRKKLGEDGFKREALGIYDSEDGSAFDTAKWHTLADLEAEIPERVCLVLDVSPDKAWSSIGVAGEIDGDLTLVMNYSIEGTAGVVPKVVQLMEKRNILEVAIFAAGQARVLEPDLVKADIEYERLSASDLGAAQGALGQAIKEGTVRHLDQPELNLAVANAKTRILQSGESEQIDRRARVLDLSPIVACAGAFYRWGLIQAPMPTIF